MNSSATAPNTHSIQLRLYPGIFLLSASGLGFEILMIRLLSITLWYHFVFMVISVAMLGFGASGTVIALLRNRAFSRIASIPSVAALAFSIAAPVAMTVLAHLNPNLYALGYHPANVFALAIIYFLMATPFFCIGLAVASLLETQTRHASLLYGADLLGAGMACLLVLPLLMRLGLPGAVLGFSIMALCAAWLLKTDQGRWFCITTLSIAVILTALIPFADGLIHIKASPDKMLAFYAETSKSPFRYIFQAIQKQIAPDATENLNFKDDWPQMEVLSSTWDRLSRIDAAAYSDRHAIYGIGAPSTFSGNLPDQIMITQDGDAATFITQYDPDFGIPDFLDRFLYGLPYQVVKSPDVMIIGAGGGTDVLAALKHNARSVYGIELNPATIDAVKQRFNDFAGNIYTHPCVTVTAGEGRSALSRLDRQFDLIQMTGVDTWAASSQGAYVLSESYLYTMEAFREYYLHLKPGGVLSIVRARFTVPRETLRLCSIGLEMLRYQNIPNPGQRMIVVSENTKAPNVFAGFLLKKGEWTPSELAAVRFYCRKTGFTVMASPDRGYDNPFSGFLRSPDPELFMAGYPFDIRPITDDQPYFFKLHRWRHLRMNQPLARFMGIDLGARPGSGHESGLGVLVLLAVQAILFSFIFIAMPVLISSPLKRSHRRLQAFLYFTAIGLGFMFIEVAAIQQFILFLGYPTRSFTVVLLVMLSAGGAGSLLSNRLTLIHRTVMVGAGVMILLLTLSAAMGLGPLLRSFLSAPDGVRIALSALLITLPAILMGFFFPMGLRAADHLSGPFIPWAWCINGCASVLGSIFAAVISLTWGFNTLLMIGGLLYLTASIVAVTLFRVPSTE